LFNLGEVACCQFDACRADTPNEFCQAAFRGKHDAQKKQIASLRRFHIGAERLGGVYQNDLVGSRGFSGLGHLQGIGNDVEPAFDKPFHDSRTDPLRRSGHDDR